MPSPPHEGKVANSNLPNQRVSFSCPNDTMPHDLAPIPLHRFRPDHAGERLVP